MSHGNTVANGDRREHHRCSPGCPDSCLDSIRKLVKMHVPRDDLVV